jgi:hypothetical protein
VALSPRDGSMNALVLRLNRRLGPFSGFQPSARGESASLAGDSTEAGLRMSFFCRFLASTLNDGSIGFSTRRDDPSNRELSVIICEQDFEPIGGRSLVKLIHVRKFHKRIMDGWIGLAPKSPSLCDIDFGQDERKVIGLVPMIETFTIVWVGDY